MRLSPRCGRHAAELYGGTILLEHLEDHRENYTRFVLLSAKPETEENANKVSLVVRVKHQPGALYSALGVFAKRGIDLLKIESRPLKGSPWHYSFYLDIGGSTATKQSAKLLPNSASARTNSGFSAAILQRNRPPE